MKVSLIISVYTNTLFLKTVLDALHAQTVLPDEVIVSEDGESEVMREFMANYTIPGVQMVHMTQTDSGWQKNRALNRAITAASHAYLIFIDGDCVLHTRFIENHLRLAHPKHILAGKRVKLGPRYSENLRQMPLRDFQKGFMWHMRDLRKDGAEFVEEGVYIPLNMLTRGVVRLLGITSIKGCNFSCYKAALMAINGFDEDYILPAVGEDHDLVWRFRGLGYRIVSAKHFVIQYHLYHPESWTSQTENLVLFRQKEASKNYRCLNGIIKRSS